MVLPVPGLPSIRNRQPLVKPPRQNVVQPGNPRISFVGQMQIVHTAARLVELKYRRVSERERSLPFASGIRDLAISVTGCLGGSNNDRRPCALPHGIASQLKVLGSSKKTRRGPTRLRAAVKLSYVIQEHAGVR